MKRSFTFSYSRKVSTAPYENTDVFAAEGVEVETEGLKDDPAFHSMKDAIVLRTKRLVDDQAELLRAP